MKPPKPTKYAQIGDKVKIITPKIFVRCGYTLTPEILHSRRMHEVEGLARAAWQAMSIKKRSYTFDPPARVYNNLISAATSFILNEEKFGGPEHCQRDYWKLEEVEAKLDAAFEEK